MRSAATGAVMMRRRLMRAACSCASGVLLAVPAVGATEESRSADSELIGRAVGGAPVLSPLVRLQMPPKFGNGYSVPMTLEVDSPMSAADHVRLLHVLAPMNPIVAVATFRFNAGSGRAAVSTRIRLARSQDVVAIAEMSDGALLMARTHVEVDTDGCA